MEKLDKRIREVEEDHAGEIVEGYLAQHQEKERSDALFILGGICVADRIAKSLSSEAMRSLIRFQEEKRHEVLGYKRFVDFLDSTEYRTVSKAEFYERKALLEKEGDQVFDLLSDLGVSIRKRKLLGKGNVEIDGENVIIHDGDEETSIAMTDRTRLLETLSALADANADKTAKLDKQKQKIDKHADEKRDLYDELDRERGRKLADLGQDGHAMALANFCFAAAALRDEAAKLAPLDREARRDNTLEVVAGQLSLIRSSYGKSGDAAAATEPVLVGETASEMLDNFLDGVDLGGNNDAELAANL